MERKKILIVDDEYTFCKALKAFLEKNGFDTIFTTNGEQALDMIEEEKPDLMTLDIRMPGIDGIEVLERAKAIVPSLPVIVVSAIDMPKMVESLKTQGAREVFYKPVNLQELLKAVKEIAGETRQAKDP